MLSLYSPSTIIEVESFIHWHVKHWIYWVLQLTLLSSSNIVWQRGKRKGFEEKTGIKMIDYCELFNEFTFYSLTRISIHQRCTLHREKSVPELTQRVGLFQFFSKKSTIPYRIKNMYICELFHEKSWEETARYESSKPSYAREMFTTTVRLAGAGSMMYNSIPKVLAAAWPGN